jgi:hypothetical protein
MAIPCAKKPGFSFTVYPCAIDNSTIPVAIDDLTPVDAELFNRVREATLAIEYELGINPSSTYSTVSSRLQALEDLIAAISGESTVVSSVSGINGINSSPTIGNVIVDGINLLPRNGSRSMSGNLTMDGYNIVNASLVNGVPLTASGSASQFLAGDGTYKTITSSVSSVSGTSDIIVSPTTGSVVVDGTSLLPRNGTRSMLGNLTMDGYNIVNAGAVTATSFNSVPLTASGSASQFLAGDGTYKTITSSVSSVSGTNGITASPTTGSVVVDGTSLLPRSGVRSMSGNLTMDGYNIVNAGAVIASNVRLSEVAPSAVTTSSGNGAFFVGDGTGGTTANTPYYKNSAGTLTSLLPGASGSGWDAVVTSRAELVAQGSLISTTLTITNKRLFVAGDIQMLSGEQIVLSGECVLQGRAAGASSRIRYASGGFAGPLIDVATSSTAVIDNIEVANVNASGVGIRIRDTSIVSNCRIQAATGIVIRGTGSFIANNYFFTDGTLAPAATSLVTAIAADSLIVSDNVRIINNRASTVTTSGAINYVFLTSTSAASSPYMISNNQHVGYRFISSPTSISRWDVVNNQARVVGSNTNGCFILADQLVLTTVAENKLINETGAVTTTSFFRNNTTNDFTAFAQGFATIANNQLIYTTGSGTAPFYLNSSNTSTTFTPSNITIMCRANTTGSSGVAFTVKFPDSSLAT